MTTKIQPYPRLYPGEAMILAAGRGERMRPLTDHTPKPLLQAGGRPLIEYHIERLAAAGFKRLVINLAHLGEQISDHLGDGARFGVEIRYSPEPLGALETGGGIRRGFSLVEGDALLVVNGDIWTDIPLDGLAWNPDDLAHLALVPNPIHNTKGDFGLEGNRLRNDGPARYTFSGVGIYRRELFEGTPDGPFPLAPLLRRAADQGRAGGQLHRGEWMDIGTPERLRELDERLSRENA